VFVFLIYSVATAAQHAVLPAAAAG
jgi:hypothetical protein